MNTNLVARLWRFCVSGTTVRRYEHSNKIELLESVLQTQRVHLFPFRTQKLSSAVVKILYGRLYGKIAQCRHSERAEKSALCTEKTEKANLFIKWGCSSAGRAPALQAGGHGFESHHLHQVIDIRESLLLKMFIENRINKRNETDSCILRKTCY